ncbi:MAG: lipid-A-disaccharide synthase [Flavobacteriales bacterium]|nr:lipid-A-disaccharide synthase [Flavobacteriales bacterium]
MAIKKVYFSAGEASGDVYGGQVASALRQQRASVEMRGMGGDAMEAAGVQLVEHIRKASFMGFWEVLVNLRAIRRTMQRVKKDILEFQPDRVLTIDYPGFNLRLAAWCKAQGIPVDHYISPQVWAWKKRRIPRIADVIDRLYVILPFEREVYAKHIGGAASSGGGDTTPFEVEFVGHPLLDTLPEHEDNSKSWRTSQGLSDSPLLALLPGSRPQEIQRMMPVLEAAAADFPDHQAVVAGAPGRTRADYPTQLPVLFGQTRALFQQAQAGWITSGTATLEAALHGLPHIIVYRTSPPTYFIARLLARVEFIGLTNLILGRKAVPERIQGDCTAGQLSTDMRGLLNHGTQAAQQRAAFAELRVNLGGTGASDRVAECILRCPSAPSLEDS